MNGHHHHHDDFFDSDDPLFMMGVAMVGMSLQEAAEAEERERRARLTPWQRAEEDRRNREAAETAWKFLGGMLSALVGMALAFAIIVGIIALVQLWLHLLNGVLEWTAEFIGWAWQWIVYFIGLALKGWGYLTGAVH